MAQDLAYLKRWRYDRDRGIARTIDAAPVRTHLATLRTAGMTWRAISEVCDVTASALCAIGLGQTSTINATRARRILTVRPGAVYARANVAGHVPAVGARRRIRALLAIGWTHAHIAEAAGIPARRPGLILSQAGTMITLDAHDRIADAYDDLSMRPGPSTRNRRLGYPPPLAWDDIDDPAEMPSMGARERGIDLDDWMHLINGGATPDSASERCGVTLAHVKDRARRQRRGDVLRAIAQHILASSSYGHSVDYAQSLLAEARAA